MRRPRSAVLFFVLLVLGLSLAVPGVDLAETAYDESEAPPYESAPLISDVMPQATASAAQGERSVPRRQLASPTPFRVPTIKVNGTDAQRCAEARVALAFLCTLLC